MTPERWAEIGETYQAALAQPREQRAGFLDAVCGIDAELRREVESLLAAENEAGEFLSAGAMKDAAKMLAGDQQPTPIGKRLGDYQVLALAGAGGMGEVYRARDTKLGREVAIKILPSFFSADPEHLRRFEQEAFTASALNHPNILTVFGIGEADSLHFIVTEYVHGQTLRHRTEHSRLTIGEALDIAVQIASALVAAHRAGVVHRDIKPENIMIRHDDGIVKVLDFGLAKLLEPRPVEIVGGFNAGLEAVTRARFNTTPGIVMGTANYMSPEQARGLGVDERTDIWSLGVVLYEMVARRAPFEGLTTSDVVSMILQREPQSLTVLSAEASQRLDEIVTKALAKDREKRYQVAKDLLIDLKTLKQHLDFETEIDRTSAAELGRVGPEHPRQPFPPSAAEPGMVSAPVPTRASSAEYLITEIKRHRKGVALVAAGIFALLLMAVVSYWWRSRPLALTDKDTILIADFVNATGDPVFDGTLKEALAGQLAQSPFLNIFSDERVRDALRFMGRSPDEHITREAGREICQRQGLKAVLSGSISQLGSHYFISLEAINAQTGDTFARQQVEAEAKEQVLKRLGEAATKLREKLGESLASIQKFDALIEQATTPSLEALKAYSLGREQAVKLRGSEAIALYKRAIELDPNFARAYNSLSIVYFARQEDLAVEAATKAFALRERTSEYEKLKITADYYRIVTGETEKSIEALQSLTLMYPRDDVALNNLASLHLSIGQYEKAVEELQEAIRLNPNMAPYGGLAAALRCLNRLEEAKQVFAQPLAQKLSPFYHNELYRIAYLQQDAETMQRELDVIKASSDKENTLRLQAIWSWFRGQERQGRESWNLIADLRSGGNRKDLAADAISSNAWRAAVFGNCREAREDIARASALARNRNSFLPYGLVQALCGEVSQAQSLVDEYARRYPSDTLLNSVKLPILRAAIQLGRKDPNQVIPILRPAISYDWVVANAVTYWPTYLRGQAYLAQRQGAEAAAEFQKILDRKALAPGEVLYPLAYVGLARAAALMGDTTKARKAYQDFFAIWKDADPDIPILVEAKREYGRLDL